MTTDRFRKMALALPEVVEQAHMGHPDFRVQGRIFATLGYPRDGYATVMLTPYDQDAFVTSHPEAFIPVKGKWGEQGATSVVLGQATAAAVSSALEAAYERRVAQPSKRRKR